MGWVHGKNTTVYGNYKTDEELAAIAAAEAAEEVRKSEIKESILAAFQTWSHAIQVMADGGANCCNLGINYVDSTAPVVLKPCVADNAQALGTTSISLGWHLVVDRATGAIIRRAISKHGSIVHDAPFVSIADSSDFYLFACKLLRDNIIAHPRELNCKDEPNAWGRMFVVQVSEDTYAIKHVSDDYSRRKEVAVIVSSSTLIWSGLLKDLPSPPTDEMWTEICGSWSRFLTKEITLSTHTQPRNGLKEKIMNTTIINDY